MLPKLRGCSVMGVIITLLMGVVGCSNVNAECKLAYSRDGKLEIIVNPPGESGESSEEMTLQRNILVSSPGGEIQRVYNYVGTVRKSYEESGNEYLIAFDLSIEDEKMKAYEVSVTGGVYGDSPHVCSYP